MNRLYDYILHYYTNYIYFNNFIYYILIRMKWIFLNLIIPNSLSLSYLIIIGFLIYPIFFWLSFIKSTLVIVFWLDFNSAVLQLLLIYSLNKIIKSLSQDLQAIWLA